MTTLLNVIASVTLVALAISRPVLTLCILGAATVVMLAMLVGTWA